MAGNWKMYKNAAETAAFFGAFRPLVEKTEGRDVVICPPFVNIPAAVAAAAGSKVEIGGQDLYWAKEGAFTGEVSAPMLAGRRLQVGHHRPQRTPAVLRRDRGNGLTRRRWRRSKRG